MSPLGCPQGSPLLTLAECVLSGSIPRGEIRVLDEHLEFHLILSHLGSNDGNEGRGCGSVGLSWPKTGVSGFSAMSARGAGAGIGQAALSWQQLAG